MFLLRKPKKPKITLKLSNNYKILVLENIFYVSDFL